MRYMIFRQLELKIFLRKVDFFIFSTQISGDSIDLSQTVGGLVPTRPNSLMYEQVLGQ